MSTLQTILIIAGFAVILYLLLFRKEKQNPESMLLVQEQMKELRLTLNTQQGDMQKTLQTQFSQSTQIVRDVTERLTKLDETNKQVMGFAEQLQSLENILKNPKQRGILGEYTLETLLKGGFTPKNYKMQYAFKDGQIVDAALFIADKIIPIDSKFSLENYNK